MYVDDTFLASLDKLDIEQFKQNLKGKFDMKELGNAKRILGIDILRDRKNGTLRLVQESYALKLLSKFRMLDCKPTIVPIAK